MKKFAIVAGVCLVAGFAAARWLPLQADDVRPAQMQAPRTSQVDDPAPLAARIDELERAVRDEREARQVLEEEILYLADEIERLQAESEPAPGATQKQSASVLAEGRRQRIANRNSREARVGRLVAAGFPDDRAEWIVQRESRMRMVMLEARHEAERNGGAYDGYRDVLREAQQSFQADLGQPDYERYLEATGRPTAVVVSSVMDTSPAQRVGLRPGDRILSYGSKRVYSMSDLNRETLGGEAGETVYVQIERNGVPMQVALPRGPLGITGGR